MLNEHNRIVLTASLPAHGLVVGDVGTVVHHPRVKPERGQGRSVCEKPRPYYCNKMPAWKPTLNGPSISQGLAGCSLEQEVDFLTGRQSRLLSTRLPWLGRKNRLQAHSR